MKCILAFLLAFFSITWLTAQNVDSLKSALLPAKEDSNKVNLYGKICNYYSYKYPDTVLQYANKGLALARQLHYKTGEINLLSYMGEALSSKSQYPKALEVKLAALRAAQELGNGYLVASCENYMGALYVKTEDFASALAHYKKSSLNQAYFVNYKKSLYGMVGRCFYFLNNIDSANYYGKQAYELDLEDSIHWPIPYYLMAMIYEKKGNTEQALQLYKAGNQLPNIGPLTILNGYNGMASVFKQMGERDSAIFYASKVVGEGSKRSLFYSVIDAGKLLVNIYQAEGAMDSAFKYQQVMLAAKDSIFSKENIQSIQTLTFNEQKRLEEAEQARKLAEQEYRTKVKVYSLLAGVIVLLTLASILYRNNHQKQRAKVKIEKAYADLKTAEAQLIQSEKMASLGELTAGIAHEIQNPLNFVNNFSDVNKELLLELKEEVVKGNLDEVNGIADDVINNSEKINHHGKRADAIVKGMLQHSRKSEGSKEPTDINKLCDEYLRLSYHGLRAKDTNFNATLETNFDESSGKINIIPQDIGRVLLNLFNNAFYAVNERFRQAHPDSKYDAKVSVTTKAVKSPLVDSGVCITVSDNGSGIPVAIVDKIFQPFFTTKPTGSGTGLGLSLAYDVLKAHGGGIKVESKEGEGTNFIIQLPAP